MNSSSRTRLHELTSRLCDGEIDARELNELSALLDHNQEGLQEYVDYTSLHLQLGNRLRAAHSTEEFQADILAGLERDAGQAAAAKATSRQRISNSNRIAFLAVAASILIAGFFIIRSSPWEPEFTARVVQKIACEWGDEHWDTTQSPYLEAGREINLDRGLMLLEFGNGAEVMLEAPIEFTILARDRGDLHVGKLTATVPKRGRGFTVNIPAGEVVDLGTNFGLMVDKNGNSETHVFTGKVELRTGIDADGHAKKSWSLIADEALKLTKANKATHLSAKSSFFVHASPDVSSVSEEDNPVLAIPADSKPVLWLDAARRIQLDSDGRVVSWGDLSPGETAQEDNAWQVQQDRRPLWIANAQKGQPTVRFDGAEFLMTTPFQTGENLTAICVFHGKPSEFSGSSAAQILSFSGSPSLILQQTKDNQFEGAILTKKQNGNQLLSGRLEETLRKDDDEPTVAAYLYDNSKGSASLYVDGILVGKTPASETIAVRSPKIIGRSNKNDAYFVGDLYEVLLFNTALTSDQCIRISNDLMEKYDIPQTDPEPRVLSGLVPEEEE